jgi:hypothetical protein
MTTKPLDPEDPMALVGVGLERGPDDEALTEMARCFVEEYARMGWSGERIMRLFRNPFYRGPHRILQVKGEEFVRSLVETIKQTRAQVRSQDGR